MDSGVPVSTTHDELARDNYLRSNDATSPEWRVTMLFYAAVHAADHVLYGGGFAPDNCNHTERGAGIRQHPKLRGIEADYRQLSALSRTSRYMPRNHPMPATKVNFAGNLAARVLGLAGIPTAPTVLPLAASEGPSK